MRMLVKRKHVNYIGSSSMKKPIGSAYEIGAKRTSIYKKKTSL